MYSTEGIVLTKIPAGEADALVTLYTRDFGKIRALVQGVKKEEAKLKGHVEPITLSRIQFVDGRRGERLTYAAAIHLFPRTRGDFQTYTAASRMVNLVDASCFPGQKDEPIWNLLLGFLLLLECPETDVSADVIASSFEDELHGLLGNGNKAQRKSEEAAMASTTPAMYNSSEVI